MAALWLLVFFLIFAGCGGAPAVAGSGGGEASRDAPGSAQTPAQPPAQGGPYAAAAFADSGFSPEQAQGTDRVQVDASCVRLGYVGVAATSEKRLKCQVIKGETTYTYDLPADGTPAVFPLQSGDGDYRLRVMENVVDNKYACLYSTEFAVALQDEFQPFLRPNRYVDYNRDSACVQKAAQLAAQAADAPGVVKQVYDYICANVSYDVEKAETVQSGYLPDVDETLSTGKGICFDYASLAAAMLRSRGIPAKVIFGYVSPDDLYHAWNMFYTQETGWVTVNYEVKKDTWNRLDLTFSANGADGTFIGNGENYSDLYCY